MQGESEFSEGGIDDATTNENDKNKDNCDRDESASSNEDDEIIFVPANPKTWTAEEIVKWIAWAKKSLNLNSSLDHVKFPRNGEELSKFNKAEFYIASGSLDDGRKLAQHYKYLMQNVNEECHESLLSDGEPG